MDKVDGMDRVDEVDAVDRLDVVRAELGIIATKGRKKHKEKGATFKQRLSITHLRNYSMTQSSHASRMPSIKALSLRERDG